MIKRTIYVGNPLHLRVRNEQLELNIPHAQGIDKIIGNTIPLEDIGILIIDNSEVTLSHAVMQKTAQYNIAFIICDDKRHPISMQLPLDTNTLQQERFRHQIDASEPLKKRIGKKLKFHQTIIPAKHALM